jgi:RHS repeat-associated protein
MGRTAPRPSAADDHAISDTKNDFGHGLLAFTPPSDYVLLGTLSVPTSGTSTESFVIPAYTTYYLVASGTGMIASSRGLDAEYVAPSGQSGGPWLNSKQGVDWGIGLSSANAGSKGMIWSPSSYQTDSVYGTSLTAGASAMPVALKYFDDQYGDNSGSLTVDVYAPVDYTPTEPGEDYPETEPGEEDVPCDGSCPPNKGGFSNGVRLSDGDLLYRPGGDDTGSLGIGPSPGLEWNTDGASSGATSVYGNGWNAAGQPVIEQTVSGSGGAGSVFRLSFSPFDQRYWTAASSTGPFARAGVPNSTDTLSLVGGQFVFNTSGGDTLTFNGVASSVPAALRGRLVAREDSSGNRLAYTYNTNGSLAKLESFFAGQTTPVEIREYAYLTSPNANAGKLAKIDIRRGDNTLVRSTAYAYYDGTSASGRLGDLTSITVLDSAGSLLDARFYRYSSPAAGVSLLEYTFDTDAVRRATAAGINLVTAAPGNVATYATNYYQYDSQKRVIRHDVQGSGCSSCSNGIGTYTYTYVKNPVSSALVTSRWNTKTTETRPDGTQRIVYLNARTQPMLEVIRTQENGITTQIGTYTRYDANGLPIWRVSPSALALPTNLADIEQYPDLLNEIAGNFQYISDSTGLIEVTTYGTSTTATAATPGDVARLVSSTGVKKGDLGTTITQEAYAYFSQSASDGSMITPLASRKTYPSESTSVWQETSYSYAFASGTTRILAQQTTLPVITSSQNGSGVADVTSEVFDESGRVIWSKDGDGFLTYTAYDAGTGAVVKTITDVDTSRTSEFQSLPTGWSTRAGGGLHLVTAFEADYLGRTTKTTDPRGNVTYTVYNDVGRETRTYVGWNATTRRATGPIEVSRKDSSGTYTETLTFAGTPATNAAGRPSGTEAITNLQSLTRSIVNSAGQLIAVDRYTNLASLAYTTNSTLGAEGTNYLRTRYAYDNHAQVDRVQSPAGTITHSIYDGFSRLIATWIGTDDSTTNGLKWTPTTGSASSNMTLVQTRAYDVSGNLVSVTQLPGGAAAPRTTSTYYDWRNRPVVTKAGDSATPSTEDLSVNRPLTYVDYDNLGRIVGESIFDGDGVSIVDSNSDGIPDKPAAALLRSYTTSSYDSQDRVILSQGVQVDQASGTIAGTPVKATTRMFYDRRGNIAAVYSPSGPVSQSRFDGAGRLTSSFTLGNSPSPTWVNATSLQGSIVLEQTDYTYDEVGNLILSIGRQRFHDAAAVAGALGTPTSGISARVSYAASYYDAANRVTATVDVGTNGGTSYVRPTSTPAGSATTLLTTYDYDVAGRVQTFVDPRGITSAMVYDALGRTTISIKNFMGGAPGAEYDVMTVDAFDAAGRLTSRTADPLTGTSPQVTAFVYGVSPATGSLMASNDILAETRYPDPLTGEPSSTDRDVYTVNALGERLTYTDRAGTTHTYTYDVVGRRISDTVTTLGTGVNGAVRRIETAYDALGNATSVTSFNAATGGSAVNQVVRAFTSFGQLTSEWQSHTGLVSLATTPRVQYAYSQSTLGAQTRLSQMTYPDGYTLSLNSTGYDLFAGRVTNISGAQAGSGTSGVLEAFKYLGASTVAERSRPEVGITLTMATTAGVNGDGGDKYTGLDRFSRVVDQRWTNSAGADVDRYGYTYDEYGNRTGRSNALASAFSETYGYEGLNQLQTFTRGDAQSPSLTQGWQFDALGNWTTVTTNGTDQTRVFNAQNELLQVGAATLTYSATGNMTTDAQGRTLVYDAWNRLVSVSNASGTQVAAYQYDGMNRRIVEQVAATGVSSALVRDLFYSQAWQVLEERIRSSGGDIPATADTRYIWSPVYVDALVARDRNADVNNSTGAGGLEERVYALQDANWNTTAIVAASGVSGFSTGAVINRFAYTPYGDSQTLTASWGTPATGSAPTTPWQHLFQGLKFSDVTGLAYVRARDYSATLGRFIELDPIGFDAGDNNWYRFVGNRPTGNVDPSGLCARKDSSIEIVVQAYIPYDDIIGPDGYVYGGDGRHRGIDTTPGAEDNDYRIRLHYFNGRAKTDAGVTKQYRDGTSPAPIREAEDKEGVQMKHRAFEWSFKSRHYYRVEGMGKNPLISFPFVAFNPAINYAFTVLFDGCSRAASIETGRHDGFPSYEVFARLPGKNWVLLYHHDAVKENQTVFSLYGRGEYRLGNTRPLKLE